MYNLRKFVKKTCYQTQMQRQDSPVFWVFYLIGFAISKGYFWVHRANFRNLRPNNQLLVFYTIPSTTFALKGHTCSGTPAPFLAIFFIQETIESFNRQKMFLCLRVRPTLSPSDTRLGQIFYLNYIYPSNVPLEVLPGS